MHQDQCVQIAREAAVACGERHSYMPDTDEAAATWQPHRWVIDAMLVASGEAERERDSFRAGNTDLLEILMNLCMGQTTEPLIKARVILTSAGLMSPEGKLNWDVLEARRPKPISWEQAVNECVTDPAERARLLALGDATD